MCYSGAVRQEAKPNDNTDLILVCLLYVPHKQLLLTVEKQAIFSIDSFMSNFSNRIKKS